MNESERIEAILKHIDELFVFIYELIDEQKMNLDDQYKQINYTYFKCFTATSSQFIY